MDGWIWKRTDGNGENDSKRERSGVRLGEMEVEDKRINKLKQLEKIKKKYGMLCIFFQKKIKG